MNYMKSPLKQKKSKSNRRVLSGGEPAKRKRSSIFDTAGSNGNGSASYGKRKKDTADKKRAIPSITPWKVIVASVLIAASGLIYINHVFSTQQTLMEVQQLENEFNRAQRAYEEQRLIYDRMVGPKQIYQQARTQGFINAGPADQIIIPEP
ncbi:hypothetical protein DYD21_18785 [Rhodohalobacter sp. SW132]|uniref:hypothetical protein n=1 Tax=Rhodohalobacter sp. SW132 TaxID=2293433 RepID=UPI000E23FA07|nr:hypothetical protein [Rhodohalobacter sp. SW132]REL24256.1 hypothetical protein DYD21_18785 [Rhodohalobacter sp. SW132]